MKHKGHHGHHGSNHNGATANASAKPSAPAQDDATGTRSVLVVGGHGGLVTHYRAVVEERGFSLRHFEQKVPAGARRSIGKVALVVIMATMISHTLRDSARELAGDAPIVYLKSPSVSALRAAVSGAT